MVLKPFYTDALAGLCPKDQLDLLDSVDSLRSQGISHYVSLPQIIVCGDQSSGKSSVLEAVSGVSFPIKSNLCTRFPTELVLRRNPQIGVRVSIVPHHSRSESEQASLSSFHEKLDGFEGLPALIEKAKAAMGISTHGKAFSKDLLRVEVSGPDRPPLTIVDLPGLIHSETKQQSASDVEMVQEVVQSYMREPRSIILAVVSAKNDYANQIVLKLAREADPKGIRTLGVITKPDTLIPASESEAMYVSLARNQDVEFRLGWHVLRNLDSETGQWTLADRAIREQEFFSQGIWKELPQSILGVETLRDRLSTVLLSQIATELPSLIDEIETKSSTCRNRLARLGEPRATLEEQRLYLLHMSQLFQSLVKAAIDGTYNDTFFEDPLSKPGYDKRIRGIIQNLNEDFARHIAKEGHRREITNSKSSEHVSTITRDDFVDHIRHLMRRTRGRELPGTFNPMIVADLFLEQSAPWEAITRSHIDKVWKAVTEFLNLAAAYVADAATSKTLFRKVFEPALNELLGTLNAKTTELLTPHQKSHPITYNHYFTETIQKVRSERNKNEYSKILKDFFGVSSLENIHLNQHQHRDLRMLLTALMGSTEPDMNRFACSEALDYMEAYYKVALKRFVDDISVEVVEAKLILPLGDIFSPVAVSTMSSDLVSCIAGESEETRAQREQLNKQLDVLMKGSDTCKRFIGARLLDDGTAQEETHFNNDFESHGSNDSDVATNCSLDDDTGPPARAESPVRETSLIPEVTSRIPEVDVEAIEFDGWPSTKKSKKSKISAKRAVFENDNF